MPSSQGQGLADLAKSVQTGSVSASSLVEKSLHTIEKNKDYDAIISEISGRSRQRAKDIDQKISNGETVGQLAGVPFIAKDNFLTFGSETTAASNILKGFTAPYQATAIEKLESEGAICVAKANLDAFGHGASTEHSDFMTTKNPYDSERVPGGSSGGPAASVVLDMAPFAIGTDTGGSNRQPASLSGCVGYKPTYGLVSRSGVVAMASSTDTIGPLTRTVEDTAYVLDIMAGRDPLDSTTIESDMLGYKKLHPTTNNKKIGLIAEYMGKDVSEGVKEQINQVVSELNSAGVQIININLPSLPLALASYYIICPAEVSSNLSRYDGQRYGFSAPEAQDVDESYTKSRGLGFGAEAKRRIMIGTYVLSSGYYDAYYNKAQKLRTKIIQEFDAAFSKVDFLIGPVAPTTAFKIGENSKDPLQMYLQDIMTVAPSLVGLPAISIPGRMSGGLPVGVQLIGPQRSDRRLLEMALSVEELIK